MFWDFLEKATKDSSSHSLYFKKSSKGFSGVMCTPEHINRCFVKSKVTISCGADPLQPVGNACFPLLFQLKQVNQGFIFAVPCGNLISLRYLVQTSVFGSSDLFWGVWPLLCQPVVKVAGGYWSGSICYSLKIHTGAALVQQESLPFNKWVTALPWAFQLVVKELWDFLVARECGKLWLLSVLPSAFQLRNSIPLIWLQVFGLEKFSIQGWCNGVFLLQSCLIAQVPHK